MGEMRDSDWSREILLRSDWSVPKGAIITTIYSLKFSDIWQNFYFYRILNDEKFKMEVEQTNFVTHLIITVRSYY